MNLCELLKGYVKSKTPVFINGMGAGLVKEVPENKDDCVKFETIRTEDNKNGKHTFKEVTFIPFFSIETLSEGEKEVAKSDAEKEADKALEGI